jgi:hypothetical protein
MAPRAYEKKERKFPDHTGSCHPEEFSLNTLMPSDIETSGIQAPIHVLSLGAGVQSSTMALMAAHGEITPMPVAAIFADTQDEPKSVYDWLDWLEKQLPFPVIRTTRGRLSEDTLKIRTRRDGMGTWSPSGVPAFTLNTATGAGGMMPRQCTDDFKLHPIKREQRKILKESGQKQLTVWIGITIDEAHRMKPSRVRYAIHRWPLVDLGMRRETCLKWMKDRGFPQPPRSACIFCPYHSDREWKRLKEHEPGEFAKAVQFERDFQSTKKKSGVLTSVPFLHRSLVSLDQVDFEPDKTPSLFGNECEGMCGV